MDTKAFLQKIETRKAVVGIVGIGYVGLPLALAFAEKGFKVIGFDVDAAKVNAIVAGESYISYIPRERIRSACDSGLEATSDFKRIADCDAILLCVPTPLSKNREPDLFYIENTARDIAPYLRKGQLISLESTTYPGTTREVLVPILEKISSLAAGRDLFIAFSPEREDPQNPDFNCTTIPKVVGGLDADSMTAAAALYGSIVASVVPVSSPDAAEAAKLLENIFRAVNIALVNEMKIVLDKMGLDIWEVIEAAGTKPFGFMKFYPGPGLGGHCIPIDPFYLTWKAREFGVSTRFIELAGDVNSSMPDYVADRLMHALNDGRRALSGSRVLILGLAYKKNVEDLRESASLRLIRILQSKGAIVDYHDPHVPSIKKTREYPELAGMTSVPLTTVG